MKSFIIVIVIILTRSVTSHVEINGDITFDIQLPDTEFRKADNNNNQLSTIWKKAKETISNFINKDILRNQPDVGSTEVKEVVKEKREVTAAAVLECVYQYPDQKQLDAVLSEMMNQLTKMYVRATDLEERPGWVKRFRVVVKTSPGAFEKAFKRMSEDYRKYYSKKLNKLDRKGDPCKQQEEIRSLWRDLLGKSQRELKRAATVLMNEGLRIRSKDPGDQRVSQVMQRELATIRSHHLDALCDQFQLCYNELLE